MRDNSFVSKRETVTTKDKKELSLLGGKKAGESLS